MSIESGARTVKVCFSATFNKGYDRAYTYQTKDDLKSNQLAWVMTDDGAKKVLVIAIDDKYDMAAHDRFGPLAWCTAEQPAPLAKHNAVKRL